MTRNPLFEGDLTFSLIGAFYEVYNTLGFGFREFVYLTALERELRARNHQVGREVLVRVMYKGEELGYQKLDMVVDDKVIIEVKATFTLDKDATRQLYNYLRASNLEIGLPLHFGPEPKFYRVTCPKDGNHKRRLTKSYESQQSEHPNA